MAAAFAEQLAGERISVVSAGSEPADRLNPAVVQAMAEIGLDLRVRAPRLLSDDDVRRSDVVVTMGCGDACPIYPGKRYEDWDLRDPAGETLDVVREIRDEIRVRVEKLIAGLKAR
jgi:arsenate reductase